MKPAAVASVSAADLWLGLMLPSPEWGRDGGSVIPRCGTPKECLCSSGWRGCRDGRGAEEAQELPGRGRQDTPSVPHDEHVPVALQVAAFQGDQFPCLDLLPHGIDGQYRHPDAPSDRLLDRLV